MINIENELIGEIQTLFPAVFFPTRRDAAWQPQTTIKQWEDRFPVYQNIVKKMAESGYAFGGRHIIIGGTSGKGSVAHMTARALSRAGARVGLFISPHLTYLQERFIVLTADTPITRAILPAARHEFYARARALASEIRERTRGFQISFFEALFLMAGRIFQQEACDWVVWEVGCGGRLDATNTLPRKEIAALTNVQLDHTELLGETREAIAREKAPIFARAQAVAYGAADPAILPILEAARRDAGAAMIADNPYEFEMILDERAAVRARDLAGGGAAATATRLFGEGQRQNLMLASRICHTAGVPKDVFAAAMRRFYVPGRIEIFSRPPVIVLDVAHNPYKLQELLTTLRQWPARKRLAIMAFSQYRNVRDMLIASLDVFDHIWISEFETTQGRFAQSADGVVSDVVGTLDVAASARITALSSVDQAVSQALAAMHVDDCLAVTGSVFLYHSARAALERASALSRPE